MGTPILGAAPTILQSEGYGLGRGCQHWGRRLQDCRVGFLGSHCRFASLWARHLLLRSSLTLFLVQTAEASESIVRSPPHLPSEVRGQAESQT